MSEQMPPKPWYHKGLRFKCTQCGKCCTGAPGYVWATEEELQKIASFLQMPLTEFSKKYVRKVDGNLSLLEYQDQADPNKYNCIFLKDNRCTIHPARPKQCQTFPWWPQNLKSPQDWKQAAKACEGIEHVDADLVPEVIITKELRRQEQK